MEALRDIYCTISMRVKYVHEVSNAFVEVKKRAKPDIFGNLSLQT